MLPKIKLGRDGRRNQKGNYFCIEIQLLISMLAYLLLSLQMNCTLILCRFAVKVGRHKRTCVRKMYTNATYVKYALAKHDCDTARAVDADLPNPTLVHLLQGASVLLSLRRCASQDYN